MAFLVIFWMLQALHDKFFHSLRKVPGPALASVSQLWRNIRYFRGTWHDDVVSLHQKYGKVVRIAPDEVSFVDGTALKSLYGMGKASQKVSVETPHGNPRHFEDRSTEIVLVEMV